MKNPGYIWYVAVVAGLVLGAACSEPSGERLSSADVRELANAYYNRGLYRQAIAEYERYLSHATLDAASRANLYIVVADIYFERQQDYANALAWYMRVKHLTPGSPMVDTANKKIIACLERLDRPVDAQQALKEAASVIPEAVPESRPGEVVAVIGQKQITTGDLDHLIRRQMARLPAGLRSREVTRAERLNFLRQYIMVELLYNTARRRNLGEDPEILAEAFEMKKILMANRVQEEEIREDVRVTAADVELYYAQHKADLAEKDGDGNVVRERPLTEIREQVAQFVELQKRQEALNGLLDRLVQAEDVALYEDRIP